MQPEPRGSAPTCLNCSAGQSVHEEEGTHQVQGLDVRDAEVGRGHPQHGYHISSMDAPAITLHQDCL